MPAKASQTNQLVRLITVHRWTERGTRHRSEPEIIDFAASLDVTPRTIYRDLATLRRLYAALDGDRLDR